MSFKNKTPLYNSIDLSYITKHFHPRNECNSYFETFMRNATWTTPVDKSLPRLFRELACPPFCPRAPTCPRISRTSRFDQLTSHFVQRFAPKKLPCATSHGVNNNNNNNNQWVDISVQHGFKPPPWLIQVVLTRGAEGNLYRFVMDGTMSTTGGGCCC